jgi:hypothetical protein
VNTLPGKSERGMISSLAKTVTLVVKVKLPGAHTQSDSECVPGTDTFPGSQLMQSVRGSESWSYLPAEHSSQLLPPFHVVPGKQQSAGLVIVPFQQDIGIVEEFVPQVARHTTSWPMRPLVGQSPNEPSRGKLASQVDKHNALAVKPSPWQAGSLELSVHVGRTTAINSKRSDDPLLNTAGGVVFSALTDVFEPLNSKGQLRAAGDAPVGEVSYACKFVPVAVS